MTFRAIFCLFLLFLFVSKGHANTDKDSLLIKSRIIVLHQKAFDLLSVNLNKSRPIIEEELSLSIKLNNSVYKIQSTLDLGIWYKLNGEMDSSLKYFRLANSLTKPNSEDSLKAQIDYQLGTNFFNMGVNDSAMFYQLKSLKLYEKLKLQSGVIQSLFNLGNICSSMGDTINESKFYLECQHLAQENNDKILKAIAGEGMAAYYFDTGNYDKAILEFKNSLSIYNAANRNYDIARCLGNLGGIADEMDEPEKSITYYKKALVIYENLEAKKNIISCLLNIGITFSGNKDYENAIKFLKRAETLCTELNTLALLRDIYESLSVTYQKQGEINKTLEYYQKFTQTKDKILNIKTNNNINELKKKYETEKKEQENKLLAAESAMHKRRGNFYFVAALLLGVISLLVFFIFRQRAKNARDVAEKNEQLYRKKINEIIKEQELKSINEIMEGQENERKRIAEDLHDRLGSMLATIKLHFNAVELKIESLELKSVEQYKKANTLLDEVCDEVRKIAHNMESGVLVNFGLIHALTDLKEALQTSSNLEISINTFGIKNRLGTEIEITLYRIIQELLSNVIKHARATEVSIDLNRKDDLLTVVFSDNGTGYQTNSPGNNEGMGLKNIRSRINKLHGKFYVDSGQKSGTTNILEIPLKHDSDSDS